MTHHRQSIRRDHCRRIEQTKRKKEGNSRTLGTAGILNGDSLQACADLRLHFQGVTEIRETLERVDMR